MLDDKTVAAEAEESTGEPGFNRLAQRAPKRALRLAARTTAILEVANPHRPDKHYDVTVKLPEALKNEPVALALINGLQVKPARPVTGYSRWRYAKAFLLWAEDRLVEGELPKDLFDQYRQTLNDEGFAQRSVANAIGVVVRPIKDAADNRDFMGGLRADAQSHLRSVIAHIPSLPSSTGKKRPGMGELFDDLPDDRALFDGLNDYATWALTELQAHREELLLDPDVRVALEQAQEIVGDNIDALAWRSRHIASRAKLNPSTLCNAIYAAVCRSESPTIKERLLLGDSRYRQHLSDCDKSAALSIDEFNKRLAECARDCADDDRRVNSQIQSKTHKNFGFAQCDLLSLVKPTDAENICVQWLLAGVAVQTSGQARAQVGDYIIQPSTAFLNYTKERSKTRHKHTDYISPRSAKGKALTGFIQLKDSPHQQQAKLLDRSYLHNSPSSSSPRWRFLLVATHTQSAIRNAFLEKHPSGESFLDLLSQLRIHGDAYLKYDTAIHFLMKKRRRGRLTSTEYDDALEALKRKSPTTSKKTLSPDHVRNTRIALQEALPSHTDAEREARERAQANSNGHTADVMKHVYQIRDTSRYGIKKRADFAAAVGEIITAQSQEIRDACDATTVLTPEKVADIVGLKAGFEDDDERNDRLMKELEVSGYRLNYFGAHSKGKQRIVVAEPVTVALMLSAAKTYVERAEDESQSEDIRAEAALEFAMIEELLKQMPQDVVIRGEALFERKALPPLTPMTGALPTED